MLSGYNELSFVINYLLCYPVIIFALFISSYDQNKPTCISYLCLHAGVTPNWQAQICRHEVCALFKRCEFQHILQQ